jgi:hypothetical protein
MLKGMHREDVGEHAAQQIAGRADLATALKGASGLWLGLPWRSANAVSLPWSTRRLQGQLNASVRVSSYHESCVACHCSWYLYRFFSLYHELTCHVLFLLLFSYLFPLSSRLWGKAPEQADEDPDLAGPFSD